MKKNVVIGVLVAVVAGVCLAIPRMVESNIPTAYYITPNLRSYENVINCSGTIQSEHVQQIYLQSPVVAGDVFVSVGDIVKEGDILFRLDAEQTGQVNAPLSLVRDVSDDLNTGSATEWAALASAYGLSPVIDSMSASEMRALGEVLTESQSAQVDFGTIVGGDQQEEILAPITGVVTQVDIQPQVPAGAGKAVVTIADNKNYKVLVAIREEDIARIQVGDGAIARGVGFSGYSYTGTISKIYPTAHKMVSGSVSETVVDAEITLESPDARLKPGFTAKVEILGGNDYNLITVPYEAIRQDENNNEYVYLYEEGKLIKQVVTTGQELSSEVEILSGVSHDSVVVYNPSEEVREGAMVHIRGRANVD